MGLEMSFSRRQFSLFSRLPKRLLLFWVFNTRRLFRLVGILDEAPALRGAKRKQGRPDARRNYAAQDRSGGAQNPSRQRTHRKSRNDYQRNQRGETVGTLSRRAGHPGWKATRHVGSAWNS